MTSNTNLLYATMAEGEEQRTTSSVTKEGEEELTCAKRLRNEDVDAGDNQDSADQRSPKRRAKSHDVLFRIVVPSRQIGRVIGKVGSRIQKIREETKATIKIADAVASHEERVIIISSRDGTSEVSDAENALYQIARLILKDSDDTGEASNFIEGHAVSNFIAGHVASNFSAGHVASNMIRLLIAGSQAGCLIGMSGQNIVNLRNSSGATITILPQNQLPMCASAHESDRLVQISGNVQEVIKALEKISYQLRENPPKRVISINPTYNFGSNQPKQPSVAPTLVDSVTLELMIPETLVGGLIGKGGSNISRMRLFSGATIKVAGKKGEQEQRKIHLAGSAVQVAWAKKYIDDYIHLSIQQGTS